MSNKNTQLPPQRLLEHPEAVQELPWVAQIKPVAEPV